MNRKTFLTASILMAATWARATGAEPDGSDPQSTPKREMLNVPSPTFGGLQFWADELFFHQWHIQRNVLTGHCRLLDSNEIRQAWGTFDQCRSKLDAIRAERKLKPMSGKVVITLHGMFRTPVSMSRMSAALSEGGQYEVLSVSYPSTRGSVAEYARSLASIVEHLDGVEEINFVAHSLGNLVIRHYLADQTDPEKGLRPDPRIKRIVMLGPPNHGAERAKLWADSPVLSNLFHAVLPTTGHHLAYGWDELEEDLVSPTCEFGILAGGKGDGQGWHATLPGDDDGTVTVEEAKLAGAHDFVVLPVRHTFLPTDKQAIECTRRFLEHGYFVSAEKRQPLE